MSSLKKNDRIVTIGGIHGTIVNAPADSDVVSGGLPAIARPPQAEGATGGGQIVAARGPDGWLADFEATGRASTVGSGKRR